jgi:hypothetical protein
MLDVCTGGRAITMGQVGHFLHTLSGVPGSDSPLVRGARQISSRWPRADWLFSPSGLADALQVLTREHRNPAAHTGVLSREDYLVCLGRVRSADGILPRLLEAVRLIRR